MTLVAAYKFNNWALTTDSSWNWYTLWTGGTTSFVKAWPDWRSILYNGSNWYSDIPLNCTIANVRSVLFMFNDTGSQGTTTRTIFGNRNWWDESTLTRDDSNKYYYIRYDSTSGSGDDYIYPNAIPNTMGVWNICWYIQKVWWWADSYVWWKKYLSSARDYDHNFWDITHWNIWCLIDGTRKRFFNGYVSDFRIFNNALTPADYKNYYSFHKWFF
jgi:hypothetical protein